MTLGPLCAFMAQTGVAPNTHAHTHTSPHHHKSRCAVCRAATRRVGQLRPRLTATSVQCPLSLVISSTSPVFHHPSFPSLAPAPRAENLPPCCARVFRRKTRPCVSCKCSPPLHTGSRRQLGARATTPPLPQSRSTRPFRSVRLPTPPLVSPVHLRALPRPAAAQTSSRAVLLLSLLSCVCAPTKFHQIVTAIASRTGQPRYTHDTICGFARRVPRDVASRRRFLVVAVVAGPLPMCAPCTSSTETTAHTATVLVLAEGGWEKQCHTQIRARPRWCPCPVLCFLDSGPFFLRAPRAEPLPLPPRRVAPSSCASVRVCACAAFSVVTASPLAHSKKFSVCVARRQFPSATSLRSARAR